MDEAVAVADDRRVLEQLQVLRLPQRRPPRPVLHHVEPLHEVDDALRDVAHRAHRALRAAANGLQLDIRLHCAARVALSSAPWTVALSAGLPVPALKSVALVREGSTERLLREPIAPFSQRKNGILKKNLHKTPSKCATPRTRPRPRWTPGL